MARKIRQIDNSYHKYSPEVVAKPVDTYVTPAKDTGAGSEYRSLAVSLAGLHEPLSRFAKHQHEEQVKEDTAKGEKLYNESGNRQSYEDFMSQHKELPHNPHIKRGYLLARASNEAEIVKNALYQAYSDGTATVEINGRQVNIAESDDPAAFDTWVRQFTNNYVTENMGDDVDPEIYSNVFMPQVVDSVKALAGTHIKYRQDVLMTKTVSEHTQLMQNVVRDYTNENGAFYLNGIEGSLELSARLSGIGRAMNAQGVPLAQAQEAVFTALVALADDDGIPDREQLLDVAKNVSLTDDVLFGNSPEYMAKLQNAIESAQMQKERREEKARRDAEREREEKINGLQLAMMNEVINGRPISRALMKEMSTADGVKPDEFNAFLSYAEHIANSLKPKGDGGAAKARKKQEEAEAELRFVLKVNEQEGKFTVDDVRKSGMGIDDQIKYVKVNTGDATELRKVTQQQMVKDIPDILRIYAFENNSELESDPNATSVFLNAKTEVEDAVQKQVKSNPALLEDPIRLTNIIHDETRKRVPDIKKRMEVVEQEVRKGTSANDYQTISKAGQDNYLIQKYTNELAPLVAAHNDIVAAGGDPTGTNFMRALAGMGLTPADYEARTGTKVAMTKGQQERRPFINPMYTK